MFLSATCFAWNLAPKAGSSSYDFGRSTNPWNNGYINKVITSRDGLVIKDTMSGIIDLLMIQATDLVGSGIDWLTLDGSTITIRNASDTEDVHLKTKGDITAGYFIGDGSKLTGISGGTGGVSGMSGLSGISGISGLTGISGSNGSNGNSGLSGISGLSGLSGISGLSGLTGSGVSGISGLSGLSGASGLAGAGVSGISGLSGLSGQSGLTGTGNSGLSGISGLSGLSGISGLSGLSGISGLSGLSGYSGLSGLSGYSGLSGLSGKSGISGISGISGSTGVSGLSGLSGLSGQSGQSGISGISGSGVSASTLASSTSTWHYDTDFAMFGTTTPCAGKYIQVSDWALIAKTISSATFRINGGTNLAGIFLLREKTSANVDDFTIMTSTPVALASSTAGWWGAVSLTRTVIPQNHSLWLKIVSLSGSISELLVRTSGN